jgi:hypothetical protein
VYNENSDVICVNKTWLTDEVSNKDILHSGFTIYRKERTNRCGGGVAKQLLRESRENYFGSIDNSFKDNPKRFWSALKQTSKSCSIPGAGCIKT